MIDAATFTHMRPVGAATPALSLGNDHPSAEVQVTLDRFKPGYGDKAVKRNPTIVP